MPSWPTHRDVNKGQQAADGGVQECEHLPCQILNKNRVFREIFLIFPTVGKVGKIYGRALASIKTVLCAPGEMRPRRPPTRRATALALASAPLLLYSWPDAMGSSFLKTDAHASSLPTILPAQPLLQLYTSEPPSEGRWESWTFPVDVGSAVQQLRLLFFRWPGSKVLSQSPDRRYMRVTFEQVRAWPSANLLDGAVFHHSSHFRISCHRQN